VSKKLKWVTTEYGSMPACGECVSLRLNPLFEEAVYSVSIDRTGSPEKLMQAALGAYHEQGHKSA
jgi:hypothetical protein